MPGRKSYISPCPCQIENRKAKTKKDWGCVVFEVYKEKDGSWHTREIHKEFYMPEKERDQCEAQMMENVGRWYSDFVNYIESQEEY